MGESKYFIIFKESITLLHQPRKKEKKPSLIILHLNLILGIEIKGNVKSTVTLLRRSSSNSESRKRSRSRKRNRKLKQENININKYRDSNSEKKSRNERDEIKEKLPKLTLKIVENVTSNTTGRI